MEGNITLSEFQNALEAYGVSGESQHIDPSGESDYIRFEHRALFKLLALMKERSISTQDLFNSCDINRDGSLDVLELENHLGSLSAELKQKDIHAIHNFFDIDKNGSCSEGEFKNQVSKAMKLHELQRAKGVNSMFEVQEGDDEGD